MQATAITENGLAVPTTNIPRIRARHDFAVPNLGIILYRRAIPKEPI